MQHAVELLAVLLLLAMGQCIVEPSSRLLRRVLYTFGWSVLAFGGAILVVSFPSLAVIAVQLAGLLIAMYVVRWVIASVVEHFHGPMLLAKPGKGEIAAAAARATGASPKDAKLATRRILRGNEGYLSLAALLTLGPQDAENLENAWQAACDKTRDDVNAMCLSLGGGKSPDRPSTSALQFLAQALCLYERESLKRVLGRFRECRLASRDGRERAMKLLQQQAQNNSRAELLGIEPPPSDDDGAPGPALRPEVLLWPALGFLRLGLRKRAVALSLSQAILILYGTAAVIAGHGFSGNSGYVFLGVALVIHIQALLAMGDFADAAAPAPAEAGRQG